MTYEVVWIQQLEPNISFDLSLSASAIENEQRYGQKIRLTICSVYIFCCGCLSMNNDTAAITYIY